MFISQDMEMIGSVSGGCVEGAVLKEAKAILKAGNGKMVHYGVSDEDAWAVGLSCGGKIQVYLQRWAGKLAENLSELLAANQGCILVTALADHSENTIILPDGNTIGAGLPGEITTKALELFAQRKNETVMVGESPYFVQVFPRRSQLIIIGAAHITVDLVQLAKQFDFDTIVIDPRGTFARNTTFVVKPDQILEKYPSEVLSNFALDNSTYAVILSHDPKIDDDALQVLLKRQVAYIGALGSRKNHEKRTARLLENGFSQAEISRINAPIGVDIRAIGAKEIALSIMAAIIQAKNRYL
jgi:xanthine dehydrogenase accessory factor